MPANHIFKCSVCGRYTLQKMCRCGGTTVTTKPAKWNLKDNYSKYRLAYKEQHGDSPENQS